MSMPQSDLNTFVSNFKAAFEGTASVFEHGTRFKELPEWNSMQALYVVGMIDAEYNVEFNSADLKSCTTIEEVFAIVQSRTK